MSQPPQLISRLLALGDPALGAPLILPRELALVNDTVTLGRGRDCAVVIDHPLVSRMHARIERHGTRYLLLDANSANGTYVHGRRIVESHLLQNWDDIGLGVAAPLLRFLDPDATEVVRGLLRYDEHAMHFWLNEQPVHLPPTAFRMLRHLYKHAGDVCTRESCALAIWERPYDHSRDSGALEQVVNTLRRALRSADPQADLIEARRGMGYRLTL